MDFNIKHALCIFLFINVQLIRLNSAEDDVEYDIHHDSVETHNGTGEYFEYTLNIEKKDEKENVFTVDGTLQMKNDLDNNYKISIEAFKMDENNEYQSLFAMPKMGTCDFMKTLYKKYLYEDIIKYSNLPSYDACPVPNGQYEVKGYPFDMKKFTHLKKYIKPGKYRLNFFLVKDDVAMCGVLFYGHVTEKS